MPSTPFHRSSYSRVSQGRPVELFTGVPGRGDGATDNPTVGVINAGEDDQMEVTGFTRHRGLTFLTWLLIALSGGLLRLLFHWSPQWMLRATHHRCPLATAEKVLVTERYQQKHKCYYVKSVRTLMADMLPEPDEKGTDSWDDHVLTDIRGPQIAPLSVHLGGGYFTEADTLRMFCCKKLSYVWDIQRGCFVRLAGLDAGVSTAELHQQTGLTVEQQRLRRAVYGSNEMEVPVRGVFTLLFLEVLNPFYVFQLFSFCLWIADDYMYYALAILAMSAFGIIMAIIQTRKNQANLRSTVHSSDVATVVRGHGGRRETVPTEHLVPGDLLVVPSHGCVMHCDAVLLTGNAIVNESMLTGESVPVTKTPLPCGPDLTYNPKEHARHTLFCGTRVIQTRYYGHELVLAVVVRTGFSTAKGSLVRSIMYPPPVDFKFEHDSYKFVELLAGIASIGFFYTVITKYLRGISVSAIALQALDLITIVVPPALPAAMTIGRFYAQKRLEAKNVYCISPRTINVSGSIDCVCFDKTGTLTEDGLDMWGIVPISGRKFQVPVKSVGKLEPGELLTGLATCHSLTIIDGRLSGDPLDLKMFESTGWQLEEPEVNDSSKFEMIFPTVVKPPRSERLVAAENGGGDEKPLLEVGIVRQFPFTSSLQRMSVVTRTLGATHFTVFCKGSPETLVGLCRPDTVPPDFVSVLEEYTQEGYRVLALASRALPRVSYARLQRLARHECETDLTLLALVVMENRLKPGTTAVVTGLRGACIRTIMVTGDNMLTALSVARDCGIVAPGQRVVVVQGTSAPGCAPQLCYSVACSSHTTPSPDLASPGGDSLATLEALSPDEGPDYCLAMTGRSWAIAKSHFTDVVSRLATRGAVFARMSPDQKQQLVQELQRLGYYVAMCGDGANDCGALKAAHAGISLSEAESSVASPFTSKVPDISCVPRVIREGRAALVTSFGIFKYMAAYSLTQFVSVMVLYSIDTNLTDVEFLYIDLFVITTFAFFFGRTEAYEGPLVSTPPILSLISLSPVLSLLVQMAVVIILQWLAFYTVQQNEWFVPHNSTEHTSSESYENYALFSISSMQYIILALVFSKGAPYRKSICSNRGFLGALLALTAVTLYLTLGPDEWLHERFELKVPPAFMYRLVLVGLGIANLALAAFVEYFLVDYVVSRKLRYRWHNVDHSRRQFLAVERDLQGDPAWPPVMLEPPPEPIPCQVRPPRSPAAISEVCSGSSDARPSFLSPPSWPPPFVGTREVMLSPAQLLGPKRRHYSETESCTIICDKPETNGIATLPRSGKNAYLSQIPCTNISRSFVEVHRAQDGTSVVPNGSPVRMVTSEQS